MKLHTSIALATAASLLLAAAALWWAPLNQDEGWYLMAARRVSEGRMPYRDFAFTQSPLFPYVFQFAQPLIRAQGLLAGRIFQYLWLAMTFWVLLWNCRRRCHPSQFGLAALLVICLLGLNVFQMQYTATVKTYPLAAYFLCLALLGWLSYQQNRRTGTLMLCALALSAATATRLSLAVFFLPLGISLILQRKRDGDKAWLMFALSGFAGLLLFFGPFLLQAPAGLRFGLLTYHAGRQIESPWLLKAGFLSRVIQAYLPALLLLLLLLPRWQSWQPGLRSLFLGIAAVSLLHLLTPFPYDDYQAALYPAMVLLIAIEVPHQFEGIRHAAFAPLLLCGCLLFAVSSPQLSSWFSGGQDRIWWKTKAASDLHLLRETARRLREIAPDATMLFTTDSYLAIETGWEIPEDTEMGPFSYFPDLETDKAEALHVLNAPRLLQHIEDSPAPLAALSGYSFSIQSPAITPTPPHQMQMFLEALEIRYHPFAVIEGFGQGATPLTIYVSRK